jgi:predicted RNA-binding Zn ribbon-like protein
VSAQATVPRAASLIRDFVNTRDVEGGTDELSTVGGLVDWCDGAGLLQAPSEASEDDRLLAVDVREALRAALLAHHDGEEPAEPDLEGLAAALPLRLTFPTGGPRLRPVDSGIRGALAQLVASVHEAVAEGSWSRLKACPSDTCTWAFYDSSRNRSRTWCSMQVCGNRAKGRTFRERHADD